MEPFCMYHRVAGNSGNVLLAINKLSYLIASMGLQALWSSGPACFDSHALRLKRGRQALILVSLFVVGDWVTSVLFLSLGAASSSADSQE
ncbi:hypothetical protein ACET3Z_011909 [Daucus carota]